jgi:hypothetical protein
MGDLPFSFSLAAWIIAKAPDARKPDNTTGVGRIKK